MDTKKFVLAIVVAYIVLIGTAYLIHQVLLAPTYREMMTGPFRPEEVIRHKMWVMWVGQLLFTVLFAYIYTRGVEDKPWVGQGIRYGILIALLAAIPAVLSEYVVYPVPHTLAIKWMVAGAVQTILMGLVVAGIYQKGSS